MRYTVFFLPVGCRQLKMWRVRTLPLRTSLRLNDMPGWRVFEAQRVARGRPVSKYARYYPSIPATTVGCIAGTMFIDTIINGCVDLFQISVVAAVSPVVAVTDVQDNMVRRIEAARERDRLRHARRRERKRESRDATARDQARVHKQAQRERDADARRSLSVPPCLQALSVLHHRQLQRPCKQIVATPQFARR